MEWLAGLRPRQIKQCVRALDPLRVEVVCTARDLGRTLPAHWQESCQNNNTWGWEEFVEAVTSDSDVRHPAKGEFWMQHNVPRILERWSTAVPFDRIHLVTIPPAGSDSGALWQRFASVLPIEESRFPPPDRYNSSLGVASVSLMRRVNEEARQRELPKATYDRYLKRVLAKQVLARQSEAEDSIAVPPDAQAWLQARARLMVEELDALPIHVVGSLEDLIPRAAPPGGRAPNAVSDQELLATAVSALVGVSEFLADCDDEPIPSEGADDDEAPGALAATLQRWRKAFFT
jgi:hypothetical protein